MTTRTTISRRFTAAYPPPTHPVTRRRPSPAAREQPTLQEVFSNSHKRLVRVAHAILHNREDAEDAVQNAFLSACHHASDFEGRSAFTTWLTRIVINAALMIRRKRRNFMFRPFDDLTTDEAIFIERIPDTHPDPEFACARRESLALIEALLNELNPKLREAVRAAYHDGLSASEASSRLALPFARYKARLFRGTHVLQNRTRLALKFHGR